MARWKNKKHIKNVIRLNKKVKAMTSFSAEDKKKFHRKEWIRTGYGFWNPKNPGAYDLSIPQIPLRLRMNKNGSIGKISVLKLKSSKKKKKTSPE